MLVVGVDCSGGIEESLESCPDSKDSEGREGIGV